MAMRCATHCLPQPTTSPKPKNWAEQLTASLKGDSAKAIALRDWLAENIRQAGPGLTSLPLSAISGADITLNDRYGNNPDRMILLYTLLKKHPASTRSLSCPAEFL